MRTSLEFDCLSRIILETVHTSRAYVFFLPKCRIPMFRGPPVIYTSWVTIRLIDKAPSVGNVFVTNEYCTVQSLQSIFAKTTSLHGRYSATYTISPLVRYNDNDNGVCVVPVTLFNDADFVFARHQRRTNERNRRFRKIHFVLAARTHVRVKNFRHVYRLRPRRARDTATPVRRQKTVLRYAYNLNVNIRRERRVQVVL